MKPTTFFCILVVLGATVPGAYYLSQYINRHVKHAEAVAVLCEASEEYATNDFMVGSSTNATYTDVSLPSALEQRQTGDCAVLLRDIDTDIAVADAQLAQAGRAQQRAEAFYCAGQLVALRSLRQRVAALPPLPPLRWKFDNGAWQPGWGVNSNGVAVAYLFRIFDGAVCVEAAPEGGAK